MKFKHSILLVFLVLNIPVMLRAQAPYKIPKGPYIQIIELPKEANIMQIREFSGAELYDYWGECPEVLMEYGFKKLTFEDVYLQMNLYHIEIAEMSDSVAAFGAYSIAAKDPGMKGIIFENSFVNDREAMFAKGNYYVRIHTLKKDTVRGRQNLVYMSRVILGKISGNAFAPPGILNSSQLHPFRYDLKLIRGYLGLYYGFPAWVSLFDKIRFNEIDVLPLTQQSAWLNFSRIRFADGQQLEKFQKKNDLFDPGNPGFKKTIKNEVYYLFLRTGENTALFLEGSGEDPFLTPVAQQIEKTGTQK